MAYFFGDGFDLYAATTDPMQGGTYWDSGTDTRYTLVAGRFAGSRALQNSAGVSGVWLTKASGANESVHHINVGFQQTAALSGSTLCWYVQLIDGTTNQCAIVFRSDGAILLTSGAPGGTVLATYLGAVSAINTWYGFELEVVVHNTTGSFTVRKNGNTSNDFALASLDTAGGTVNNYANKLSLGMLNGLNFTAVDDFLWRSDASSVAWVGDIRCYTRMPASDASAQWTPSGAVLPVANHFAPRTASFTIGTTPKFFPFTAPCNGTVGSLSLINETAGTANIKCSIYAGSTGTPTTVLGSANLVINPGVGTTTFTFSTPVAVSSGVQYYAAFCMSAATCAFSYNNGTPPGGYLPLVDNAGTYATFPVTNPTPLAASNPWLVTINITPTTAPNGAFVADTMQDAAVSYVSSSTVGQTDLYGIAPISTTPASVVGVTTRALAQKTDAGTRNIALRLSSAGTPVTGTSTALNTSWGWIYRSDVTDPATGAAWSAVSVNNLQIGETVTA